MVFYARDAKSGYDVDKEESINLGAALDRLLFNKNSDISRACLVAEFESRLSNVCRDDRYSEWDDWALGAGWSTRDALCDLDPAEDVDETNWLQRGYFRQSESQTDSHTTSNNAALERKWGVNRSSPKPGDECEDT